MISTESRIHSKDSKNINGLGNNDDDDNDENDDINHLQC